MPSWVDGASRIGDSLPAIGLVADALTPGEPLPYDGLQVIWPDVAPGQPDNVVADGQTVAVSGTGTTLGIVGASGYGSTTGTFTVTYVDVAVTGTAPGGTSPETSVTTVTADSSGALSATRRGVELRGVTVP